MRYAYDPYGAPDGQAALDATAQANPSRFEGHYTDGPAGAVDAHARTYLPDPALFASPDRLNDAAADQALFGRPGTQSRYALAGGRPDWDAHDPRTPHHGAVAQASKSDPIARVAFADEVWADFRARAEPGTNSVALGRLVRAKSTATARRVKTGQLGDTEIIDALDRARDLHEQLAAIVGRLEHRLDRTVPEPIDPGR